MTQPLDENVAYLFKLHGAAEQRLDELSNVVHGHSTRIRDLEHNRADSTSDWPLVAMFGIIVAAVVICILGVAWAVAK